MSTADVPTNPLRRPPPAAATSHPTPPPSDPPLDPTRILGRPMAETGSISPLPGFRLMEVLGRGGMGIVFKALQVALDRVVAVKLMIGDFWLDPGARIRFALEAEAVAAVNHPNVLPVHEFGEHAGRPYLVMEYLECGSLSAWLKLHGPLAPADAARLVQSVARGVQAAHEAGIIHRDLKPANILLKATGSTLIPMVSDFGLAKRMGSADALTLTGAVMGTPGYMAPEQAAGAGKSVGPAADQYALGVILYECLAGRLPLDSDDTADILVRTLQAEPPSLRQFAPGTPPDLERICMKCLAKKPGERYPTVAEFADDLARFVNGEPVSVRPAGRVERLAKWCRRNPARATAYSFATVTLVLALATITAMRLWRNAENGLVEADRTAQQALTRREQAETAREKAETDREAAFGAFNHQSLDLAYRDYESGRVAEARQRLHTCPEASRGLEWKLLARLTSREVRSYSSPTGTTHGVAYLEARGQLAVADAAGLHSSDPENPGEPTLVFPLATVGFARGSSRIVLFDAHRIVHVLDAFTKQRLTSFTAPVAYVAGTVDPSGRWLLARDYQSAALHDLTTGERLRSFKFDQAFVSSGAMSPDGRHFALGGLEEQPPPHQLAVGTLKIYSRDDLDHPRVIRTQTGEIKALAYSPDGRRIATGSQDGLVKIWDAATGDVVFAFFEPVGSVSAMAFSPDGERLAIGGADHTVRIWQALPGYEQRVYRGHTSQVKHLSFSPDGTRLASSDATGTAKVWDLTQPPDRLQLAGMSPGPVAAAVSNDGLTLFTSDGRGVEAWDLLTRMKRWSSFPAEQIRFLHLSADSTELVIGTRLGLMLGRSAATGATQVVTLPLTMPVTPAGLTADRSLALVRTNAGEVSLVATGTGQVKASLPGKVPGRSAQSALSGDGRLAVLLHEDGSLKLWNTTSHEVRSLAIPGMRTFTVSPDGRRLAVVADGRLTFWETAEGQEKLSLRPRIETNAVLAFSTDGSKLTAVGTSGAVHLFDTGK